MGLLPRSDLKLTPEPQLTPMLPDHSLGFESYAKLSLGESASNIYYAGERTEVVRTAGRGSSDPDHEHE
jgi:hypothetical protein